MRIALVTRRYPPLIGGGRRGLRYLGPPAAGGGGGGTRLTARPQGPPPSGVVAARGRAEVPVLTARPEGPPASEIVAPGCRVERLATSRLRFVGTSLYMRGLARWFARNRVDLAYVSMLKHDAYIVVGEGRRRGFPVVLR